MQCVTATDERLMRHRDKGWLRTKDGRRAPTNPRSRSGARAELLAASLLTLVLVGFLVPPLSHAAWTAPVNVSRANQNASRPQVAVDANGDAVFTWERFDGANWRIQARTRSAVGVLSAVQTLSAAGQNAFSPQVAVDDAGDAVFTWSRSDGASSRVQTRARSVAGVLSAVQNLSDPGQNAFAPQVAVDADGDAVFAWALDVGANPQLAQARARSAAGTLSAVQNLSDSGSDALSPFPKVAVDDAGDAVFTWERFDGANLRIQTRARDSFTGNLSAVQNLGLSANIDVHQVGVDADGDAVFTWVGRDGTTNCGGVGCLRVQAQARSAAGVLSAVQNLSKGGQNVRLEHQVAVDDAGDAVFTWSRVDGLNSRVQTRARSAAGTLSAVQNLSDPGQNALAPQVAVDADGDAVFAWARFDGTVPDPDFPCCARIQARTRSAAGTLSGVQTLSAAGQDAFNPQVGVDAAGKAVATWQRFDGTNDRIQASAGP